MKISKFGWLAALVAVAAMVGAVAYSPAPASAATGTKTCNGSAAVTTTQCVLTITTAAPVVAGDVWTVALGAGPVQFDPLTPPTVATAGCAVVPTVINVTVSSFQLVNGTCAAAGAIIQLTEPVDVSASGTITQAVAKVPVTDAPFVTIATPVFFIAPLAEITATKACGDAPLGSPTGTIGCTLTITNVGPIADAVGPEYEVVIAGPGALASNNPVSATVTGGTCAASVNSPSASTSSYTLELNVANCGPGTTIIVQEVIQPTAGGVLSQTVTRRDGATATATASIGAQFRAGTTFIIRCPSSLNPGLSATFPLVVPGPIGGTEPIAIGVLPAVLICEALFVDAAGNPERVAPGTIEISSLNGTLVDLRGGLSTNLRIGCDASANVSGGGGEDLTVDVNTCQGVRFGVLGLGVGFVELRARYEPSSAAAAAGINERETSAEVAFIAPPVSLNLLLNPNPVAVGANGAATLRFNRVVTFLDELLINPQTGAPLAVNLGTPLNGTVTFTSSAPNVAAFTGGLTTGEQVVTGTVTGTNQQGVTVPTAATITVRCGSVSAATAQGLILGAAQFQNFFGGCSEVSAQYRGITQGTTNITGTFLADLPGAFGATGPLQGNVQALVDVFGNVSTNSVTRTLEVTGSVATTQRLVPGCNNVVAPVSETVAQVAARVDPAAAVISIWKQVPGTTQFQGAAIGGNVPASVSNLTSVNALDAIFICVNAAATYRIT